MFVSFSIWFSLLFLFTFFTLSVLCLFLCFLLSFSFFASSYCFSFFSLDLPLLGYLFIFGFLFLPPSPLPSFPYPSSSFSFPLWVILLSPLGPFSRLLSRFSLPFRLRLSFCCFLLCPFPQFLSSSFISFSFPLPSSPLHADSSSFWAVLAPLFCVTLRCVSLSPFSPGSLLFPFSLSSFASFSASSSSRPFSWPPPPLLPSFVYLASSFSASLTSSFFSASLPLPSSPLLPSPVFLLVLLLFLSPSVSFSLCFFL